MRRVNGEFDLLNSVVRQVPLSW